MKPATRPIASKDGIGKAETGIAEKLLAWYDAHHRELPWRTPPGAGDAKPDPYAVWLSEVMLQQTTVEAVKPYYRAFLEKWPTVLDLASAEADDVMKAWAGLGYYSRARNLRAAAQAVALLPDARFPDTEEGLRALPGVGAYTAAAIAAIAFDRPAAVVDGNVERVVSRLQAIATPLPQAKAVIRDKVAELVPSWRPGDFAQATMDLGATICTPKRPRCLLCPLQQECAAFRDGDPEHYPVRPAKAEKPARRGAAFVAVRGDGAILLRKRPEHGLLGGLMEVPTTGWTARTDGETAVGAAPFPATWYAHGSIVHVFTHFSLELFVYRADVDPMPASEGSRWCPAGEIAHEALPTLMKKVIERAVPKSTQKPRPQKQ